MCDRNEVSQSCARALHAAPHILRNNWLRKDKVVGRGASRGNALEQGLSTLSVTLPSEQIGCVLVSEGTKEKKHKRKRKERKQSRCGSCRGPRLLNNQAYAKNHCFGSSVVMCFDFLLFFFSPFPFSLVPVLFSIVGIFFSRPSLLNWALNIDWKLSGRHLGLCSQAEVALSLGTEGISSMEQEHGSKKWWG